MHTRMHGWTHNGQNTMTIARWPLASGAKKEKILVTSIFSFSHNVFKRRLSQGQ